MPKKAFSYDAIADNYAAGVDAAPYNALYERPATLSLLPRIRGAHVLDAGCGSGWYAEQLLKQGARVTAIDQSSRMLVHASRRFAAAGFVNEQRKRSAQRLVLRRHDLSTPFHFVPDRTFNGVLSPLVLHYLRDWRPTLREFARMLRRDGWLVLSTHHPATEAQRFKTKRYFDVERVEDEWKWVGKVSLFRRPLSEITESLFDSGFVIERLIEPLPVEEFRRLRTKSFERILRYPDFLHIRARLR